MQYLDAINFFDLRQYLHKNTPHSHINPSLVRWYPLIFAMLALNETITRNCNMNLMLFYAIAIVLFFSFPGSVKRRAICFTRGLYLSFSDNINVHVLPKLIRVDEYFSLNFQFR